MMHFLAHRAADKTLCGTPYLVYHTENGVLKIRMVAFSTPESDQVTCPACIEDLAKRMEQRLDHLSKGL